MQESSTTVPAQPRKLPILWIVLGIVLLSIGGCLFQLLGPNPPIVISEQTTFITEPLTASGLPDYEAHLLQQNSLGVTPENNAAPLLWESLWPADLPQEHWLPLCNALGMDRVPSEAKALVKPYDESVLAQVTRDLTAQFSEREAANRDGDETDYSKEKWQSALREITAHEVVDRAMDRPWQSNQSPALTNWINQNQRPLDLLVAASQRPRYFSPSPSMLDGNNELLLAMLLPDIQMMRTALRVLEVRAMWHLGEGRNEAAWQDLLACHRLARLTAENDTLVGQLVAIAIDSLASGGTQVLLAHGNLDATSARETLSQLQQLGYATKCGRTIDQGERLWFLDSVIGLATRNDVDGEMLGINPGALQVVDMTRVDWNVVLREGNRWYDKIVAAAALPTRVDQQAQFEAIDDELSAVMDITQGPSVLIGSLLNNRRRSEVVGNVLLGMFLPAVSAAFNAEDRNNTLLEITRLTAALAVYHAEHGEYPEKLDALVPQVLAQMPLDIYSGKPFVYHRRDDDGYLLYSVFENGVDDNGTDFGGEIVNGEWLDERSEDIDYSESDIVVRVPMPKFKLPEPPNEFGRFGEF